MLRRKAGFTLVEMLIVIVIIGVLAAALIPRFTQARERANDAARRAHLQQVATVLVTYQIDRGSYPATPGALGEMESELTRAGLSSVPTDPVATRSFDGIGNVNGSSCESITDGQYGYTPIRAGNVDNAGFVLMAGTQTEGGSNAVFDASAGFADLMPDADLAEDRCIHTATQRRHLRYCGDQVPFGTSPCNPSDDEDDLRFIYAQ